MEVLKENQLMELVVSTTPYQVLLEAQKDLFQDQIESLEYIVDTQCRLTGVNPLSQEMAAGALSVKFGKRPRDLLNPKGVNYMQYVFSIQDAISKRETREFSAYFGVTVSQIRDFFTGQRSRVRKFVRLSKEKTTSSSPCDAVHDGMPSTSDPNMPTDPVPLDTMAPTNIDEGPSCAVQHGVLCGMEESDRHFIGNIFSLMRKDESFSGKVKLLEWILRMKNRSVLNWFLTEGGVLILATWLSQAAMEEQTSILYIILKVLCSLPLEKALPMHMSAILQSVNSLRFYRSPDISNSARILLVRCSKLFAKNQPSKKSAGVKSAIDNQDEMLLKQSIVKVMSNESWDAKLNNSEEAAKLYCNNLDNYWKLDSPWPLKRLTASGDVSNERRGALLSHTQERRKVQMVEHPGQKLAVRTPQVAKSTPVTPSRPLSADEIQKAKLHSQFMQVKYGKTSLYSDDQVKPESQKKCTSSQAVASLSVSKSCARPEVEGWKKLDIAFTRVVNPQETNRLNSEQTLLKKYKSIQIPWRTPPEVKIRDAWLVAFGNNSKEFEFQQNRISREKERIYRSIQEIPSDPRDPWDSELDYDDTLTPEIPIEKLPDDEPLETLLEPDNGRKENVAIRSLEKLLEPDNGRKENVAPIVSASLENMPEPDFELLAELLKNPELVFALNSGQASSDETVKLLDMIKSNGVNSLGNLAGLGGKADNKVEVSLPSPTPSSHRVLNGPKPNFSINPFSLPHTMVNGNACQTSGHALSFGPQRMVTANTFIQPQILDTTILVPQPSAKVQRLAHMVVPPVASLQTSIQLPEQWQMHTNSSMHHQSTRPNSSIIQNLAPKMMLNKNTVANSNWPLSNVLGASSPIIWTEPLGNVKPSPASIAMPPYQLPALPQPPKPPQLPYFQEPTHSNSLRARQRFESNDHLQKNPTMNNPNAYRGPVQAAFPADTWNNSNKIAERPEFESWNPESSSSSRCEYFPGQNFLEQRVYLRHGDRPERAMQQNLGGAENKWPDHRR